MAETKEATVTWAAMGSRPTREEGKDVVLCKKIVKTLEGNGDQRVFLVGEAGIGKTRMAKKVDEEATKEGGLCYQTLWLHLNKKFKVNDKYDEKTKFEDEWTLYENIASQLCLYSDFEETEVGDRDEDEEEEKKMKDLLKDMKLKIKDYLSKMKASANDKLAAAAKLEADKKAKNTPVKKEEEPKNKNQPAVDKGKSKEAEKTEGANEDKPKPYLLLILDDEGMTSEEEVMLHLGLEDFLKEEHTPRKILITRRKVNEEATKYGGEIEGGNKSHSSDDKSDADGKEEIVETKEAKESGGEIQDNTKVGEKTIPSTTEELWGSTDSYRKIDFHDTNESKALLESFDEEDLKLLFESFIKLFPSSFLVPIQGTHETFISRMLKKSKNLPAAVVVLAKSLKCTIQSTSSSDEEGKLLKKKIEKILSTERDDSPDPESSSEGAIKPCGDNPILRLAYELLKTSPRKDTILDCFWHSLDFFEHSGSVYYRDLITQWILEGYFDPVRSVEKAYKDGHDILMELIDRGLLKIQENNVVVPEMAMRNVIDPRRRGHLGRSQLGFSRVYGGNKKKGIGKINQLDDMIKTVQAKKGDKISTILVSGDRLRRETPEKFFKKLDDLEVLGLFKPTLEPFIPALKKLKEPSTPKDTNERPAELRVLVIRDCDLLKEIKDLTMFGQLHVLEVSGATSVKEIPDGFFSGMSKLQSLHLSGLQIKSSPSSISLLKKLHCLIIRDCPLLEDLPDVQELVELEVVDVSGARGLQTCFDNTKGDKKNKSKNKNFYQLTKLQLLDFSESQIERLPIFQDSAVAAKLHSVKRLLLHNCSKLRRLPSLKPLSGLQILDLSGTTSLVEMLEVCFEDKKELKTLNLSCTCLGELATTIEELSNLNKLLLKDCNNLKIIPNIQKLTNLEVIDVSGCTELHTIEGSFEDMSYLRKVNLSGTKVETPELPKESKIHGLKRIILADKSYFEGENWSQIKEKIERARSENASSADAVVKSQEISERESEDLEVIQSSEPRASDCTEKRDVSKERLLKVPIDRPLYKRTFLSFDSASQREFMKIHESKDLSGEAQANADDFLFCEYINATRLKSIFSKTKSVKGCSLRMCRDIKDLFSGVDEESLGSLESLSIINFPSLETISWGGSFKNLKNLSIEGCPKIKTLFREASQLPSTLEVLDIKYCEELEEVIEGVELSTLTKLTLTWNVDKETCPKFKGTHEGSDWVMVDATEASPQN